MKTNILILLLVISLPGLCQVNFTNIQTWDEASKKAQKEKKLIFIEFEDTKCEQCNEVAARGLSSSLLKEKFAQNFVSIKINLETEEGRKIGAKFNVEHGPVAVFADPNGNVLNKFLGSTDAGFKYAEEADIALKRRSGKQLSDYEKEYNAGARSPKFLEEYISKRFDAKLPVDELLDQYVGKLTVDSLQNLRIVKFIYSQGPTVDSRAYTLFQTKESRKVVDSLYKTVPWSEAVDINNRIIGNSFQKAVKNKDHGLAFEAANFSARTFGEDFQRGNLYQNRNLIKFYYELKDTAQYRRSVIDLLEFNHMRLTADSLKKMDEKDARARMSTNSKSGSMVPQTINFAPASQFYHMDLNEHAWRFYEMFSDAENLERALKWSYQSQEFFNTLNKNTGNPMRLGNPAYIDTYAQILYKLGRKDEAIQWQTKAVEAQNVTGGTSNSYQETLQKMKLGTL